MPVAHRVLLFPVQSSLPGHSFIATVAQATSSAECETRVCGSGSRNRPFALRARYYPRLSIVSRPWGILVGDLPRRTRSRPPRNMIVSIIVAVFLVSHCILRRYCLRVFLTAHRALTIAITIGVCQVVFCRMETSKRSLLWGTDLQLGKLFGHDNHISHKSSVSESRLAHV